MNRLPGKRTLDNELRKLADDLRSGAVPFWKPPYEANEMRRAAAAGSQSPFYPPAGVIAFNMAEVLADGSRHDCGTVGCIGGLLAQRLGMDPDIFMSKAIDFDPRFSHLFYPDISRDGAHWQTITAEAAAVAIGMFLDGKLPRYTYGDSNED